jgi:hypothetical protein
MIFPSFECQPKVAEKFMDCATSNLVEFSPVNEATHLSCKALRNQTVRRHNIIVTTRAQAPIHENTELSWPCSSGCKMLIKFEFVRLLALHNQPVNILQIYDTLRKLGARFCFVMDL